MLEIPQHLLYSLQRVLLCTIMRKMYTVAHTQHTSMHHHSHTQLPILTP